MAGKKKLKYLQTQHAAQDGKLTCDEGINFDTFKSALGIGVYRMVALNLFPSTCSKATQALSEIYKGDAHTHPPLKGISRPYMQSSTPSEAGHTCSLVGLACHAEAGKDFAIFYLTPAGTGGIF